MKILVAGGAGFIGSHLVRDLLKEGHDVMVVDAKGSQDGHLEDHARLKRVTHDIAQPLPAPVRRFKPERIYNLACCSSPKQRRADPVRATLTTVGGTGNLLDLARENGARYLQGSSGGVYGEPAVHPQPETYLGNVNAAGTRSSHDEAHRCAESMCISYAESHGMEVKIARIFGTYGPGMDSESGRVVSNFIRQALKGDDLTVYGDGTQSRSFCFVDDMVRGLQQLMESDRTGVVNLGSGEEHTLLQLAERVLRMTGSQSRLRHLTPRVDDAHRRRPDISLAEVHLGWRPRVPLQQGLQATVEFFRDAAAADPAAPPTSSTMTSPSTQPPAVLS